MKYLYGDFSDAQIDCAAARMHKEVHRLLTYKDNRITVKQFKSDEDYLIYFNNLLFRFGGLNKILGEPPQMVLLMSTLQSAYDEAQSKNFRYKIFRKAILDCHGYIKSMFEEVDSNAKS